MSGDLLKAIRVIPAGRNVIKRENDRYFIDLTNIIISGDDKNYIIWA